MCRMASFFHNPESGEILVYDLNSHSNTEKHLKLNPKGPFREGHYLPNGTVECRVVEGEDGVSQETCNKLLKSRFPTFLSFFRWSVANGGNVGEDLNLKGLREIDKEGLEIPEGVTWLNLNSLKSAKGLKIPKGVTWINLCSLELAEGLEISKGVEYLYLSSLESAEGLKIPEGVRSLSLCSLESAEGLEIPGSVTYLYLDSLESAEGLTVGKNTNLYALELSDEEKCKIKRV